MFQGPLVRMEAVLGVAVRDGCTTCPLGTQSSLRRDALRRVLAASPTAARQAEIADRHVAVRGHTVHLATGRVSRDGDPVDIAVPTA